jgi:hypothetical protein
VGPALAVTGWRGQLNKEERAGAVAAALQHNRGSISATRAHMVLLIDAQRGPPALPLFGCSACIQHGLVEVYCRRQWWRGASLALRQLKRLCCDVQCCDVLMLLKAAHMGRHNAIDAPWGCMVPPCSLSVPTKDRCCCGKA